MQQKVSCIVRRLKNISISAIEVNFVFAVILKQKHNFAYICFYSHDEA